MKRGDVFEYGVGSHVARVVVVSRDVFSPQRATFATVIMSSGSPPPPALTVSINAPIVGTVDVTRLRPLDPTAVRARLGRLTASAMVDVDRALRSYLDLG